MQISATTSIPAILPLERQTASSYQPTGKVQDQDQATATAKDAKQVEKAPKVFTPAPPLRPNVQDYVDINRTLMSLRGL